MSENYHLEETHPNDPQEVVSPIIISPFFIHGSGSKSETQYWLRAVNASGEYGLWAYLLLEDPQKLERATEEAMAAEPPPIR